MANYSVSYRLFSRSLFTQALQTMDCCHVFDLDLSVPANEAMNVVTSAINKNLEDAKGVMISEWFLKEIVSISKL